MLSVLLKLATQFSCSVISAHGSSSIARDAVPSSYGAVSP